MPPLGSSMLTQKSAGRTISNSRDDRIGRVIQRERLAILEDDQGLFGLARNRQAPIFYRNWPWKWVLSGQC